jgi:hypothetical protein
VGAGHPLRKAFDVAYLTPRFSGLAAGLALLASPLLPLPAASAPMSADPERLCAAVMGLRPGDSQFEACRGSLATRIERQAQLQGSEATRQACLRKGLKPDTTAFAVCNLDESAATKTSSAAGPADAGPPAGSYFKASGDERRRRERLACALIGFDPSSAPFVSCVASLAAALFAADNPVQ